MQNTDRDLDVLTAVEVAKALGLSPPMIHALRKSKQLPALKVTTGGRPTWRFARSDVVRYLAHLNDVEFADARYVDRESR